MEVPEHSVMYSRTKALLHCLVIWTLLDRAGTVSLTAPKFVQQPQSQVIKQNSRAVLHCMVYPENTNIRWTFNGDFLRSQPSDGVVVRNGRLTIQSFRHARRGSEDSHEGVYQCIANNSAGVIVSDEAKLERAFLGQFPEGEDETVKATEGNTALIPCNPPRGNPNPVVTFERDGISVDTSNSQRHKVVPSGNLQIAEVKQSDEGEYRCVVENPVSGQIRVSSHTVTLHVRSPTTNSAPRFVQKLERKQVVVQGEDIVLECIIQGSPVPVVMWDKHGGQLPQGRSSMLLGNLVIHDVQIADQGTYICRAENTVGTPTADFVDLDVLEPPSIRIPPADQVAIDAAFVVFQCVSRGRSVHTEWLYNGKPIGNLGQYSISDTTLKINQVSKENEGIYQCIARSRLGMTSSASLLQVKGQDEIEFTWPKVPDPNNKDLNRDTPKTPPVISVSPSNSTVDSGRTLILPCQATDHVQGVVDRDRSSSSSNNNNSETAATQTTTAVSPSPSDDVYNNFTKQQQLVTADQYSGEQANEEGRRKNASQTIAITWYHNDTLIKGLFLDDGVWISSSPEEIENKQIQRDALFEPNNKGQEGANETGGSDINIINSDNNLDGKKELRVGVVLASGGLKIVDVNRADSGRYTCVASNTAGLSYVTAFLHVLDPTTKTTAPPDMGRSTSGLDPLPSLGPGGRNGKRKDRNRDRNKDRNGRRPDGEKSGRPEGDNGDNLTPPTTPEIKKLSDTSVMVRWNVPENDGLDVTFFKIQYKDVNGNTKAEKQWKTYSMDIPSTTYMHEVRRLKPGATYKFRVLAVYSNNDNRWSPATRRFTLEEDNVSGPTPKGPQTGPLIVKAEPIGSNTISVQWQYHGMDSDQIEGYYIYYKQYGSHGGYSRQEILGGNTERYVLRDLVPETYYTIRMRSYTLDGEGPFSNDVARSTNEVSGKPRNAEDSHTPPEWEEDPNDPWPWVTTTRRPRVNTIGGNPSSTTKSNQTLYMVLGIVLGVMLVVLLIIMLLCWRKQRRERRANNTQKNENMHKKKEQQINGGPHHFLLHNMNSNNPNGGMNGSIRNGRAGGNHVGGGGGGPPNGTNHMSLTVNPFHGTLPRDQSLPAEGSERNYSPEDLEIQNLRRSLQELLQQPPAPPVPHQDRSGAPVYYSNTASTVNINTRNQPNYYEVDPGHHDTLPRVHMATFGCHDCSSNRSRPQSRAESSLSNAPPPEYNSLALRAQPMMFGNPRSSTEIPDYSGSLHRQKPITNPYHIYNKDTGHGQYRNSPDHIPRSHERPPFRTQDVYSRSLRGPHEMNYPPGYDAAMHMQVGGAGGILPENGPDIYEQVSDNHSVGSSSGRLRARRRKQSPHRGSGSTPRGAGGMGFVPVGVGHHPRMEPNVQHYQIERPVDLSHETVYPTSQALPAMHLPQPIRRDDTSMVPPRLPPRNPLHSNSSNSPFPRVEDSHNNSQQLSQSQLEPVQTGPNQSHLEEESLDSSDRKESPQIIDDLSQDLPVLNGSLEASYGTGTDTAPPSSSGPGDLNVTTSDNLDSDLDLSDNEGCELNSPDMGLLGELAPLVHPPSLPPNATQARSSRGLGGSAETTPLMQRNIPRAIDYPSDDDNEDC